MSGVQPIVSRTFAYGLVWAGIRVRLRVPAVGRGAGRIPRGARGCVARERRGVARRGPAAGAPGGGGARRGGRGAAGGGAAARGTGGPARPAPRKRSAAPVAPLSEQRERCGLRG